MTALDANRLCAGEAITAPRPRRRRWPRRLWAAAEFVLTAVGFVAGVCLAIPS